MNHEGQTPRVRPAKNRITGEESIISIDTEQKHSADVSQTITAGCLAFYLLTVLWYTVGRREIGYYPAHFDFFWSYRLWFAGGNEYGRAIIANIAMFVPLGVLTAILLQRKRRSCFFLVFLLSLFFSACVETLQYTLLRGLFEFDDIFSNVIGAMSGAMIYLLLKRMVPERALRTVQYTAFVGIALICAALFFFLDKDGAGSISPLSQGVCFQTEDVSFEEDAVTLKGVCFWYDQRVDHPTIVLKSTRSGEEYALSTESGLPRGDVDRYFQSGRDYSGSGFAASGRGISREEEYEIILDYGFLRSIPTGVYLTGTDIHFVPQAGFKPLETRGTDLEDIVNNGFLRVYDPEHHIYVYLYDGSLYWIAEEGFCFVQDRITRLELMLWTTETEKLSERSQALGRQYDLTNVFFEMCELNGNFGQYRVCAKELPKSYAITSIKTGSYANGWIWQASFWPVFDFSQ